MASLYRLTTGALLNVTSRRIISTAFSHSAALSSAVLSAASSESPCAPEIFDIFDAPVQLRERNSTDKSSETLYSAADVSSRTGPSHSKGIYSDALDLPWSLPPPVTFDGPASPPHMSPSALKKHRLQRQNLPHSLKKVHGSSTVSCSALTPQSLPLYQLFDGPSRISRYQYPPSQNERSSFTYVSLVLCLSSAFGWLVLKDNLGLLQN